MKYVLLVALCLLGCESAREHDCKQVRQYQRGRLDLDDLRKMEWRDEKLREMFQPSGTGWSAYSPYGAVGDERLFDLCPPSGR